MRPRRSASCTPRSMCRTMRMPAGRRDCLRRVPEATPGASSPGGSFRFAAGPPPDEALAEDPVLDFASGRAVLAAEGDNPAVGEHHTGPRLPGARSDCG
mmetsp:Transcript_71348/g.212807  ORF Transcript_71348/g.212807 Transcript_71348/m.212807 type:complete len:99 (+) Transcript_71348:479-775(+)